MASYIHEAFDCHYADKCGEVQLFGNDSNKTQLNVQRYLDETQIRGMGYAKRSGAPRTVKSVTSKTLNIFEQLIFDKISKN